MLSSCDRIQCWLAVPADSLVISGVVYRQVQRAMEAIFVLKMNINIEDVKNMGKVTFGRDSSSLGILESGVNFRGRKRPRLCRSIATSVIGNAAGALLVEAADSTFRPPRLFATL